MKETVTRDDMTGGKSRAKENGEKQKGEQKYKIHRRRNAVRL